MKRVLSFLLLLVIASLAFGLPAAEASSATSDESVETQPTEAGINSPVENEASEAVLYITIGIDIELMGETTQGYGGKVNYHNPQFFDKQVKDILIVTQAVKAHGGWMTIQAKSPFITVAQ